MNCCIQMVRFACFFLNFHKTFARLPLINYFAESFHRRRHTDVAATKLSTEGTQPPPQHQLSRQLQLQLRPQLQRQLWR